MFIHRSKLALDVICRLLQYVSYKTDLRNFSNFLKIKIAIFRHVLLRSCFFLYSQKFLRIITLLDQQAFYCIFFLLFDPFPILGADNRFFMFFNHQLLLSLFLSHSLCLYNVCVLLFIFFLCPINSILLVHSIFLAICPNYLSFTSLIFSLMFDTWAQDYEEKPKLNSNQISESAY